MITKTKKLIILTTIISVSIIFCEIKPSQAVGTPPCIPSTQNGYTWVLEDQFISPSDLGDPVLYPSCNWAQNPSGICGAQPYTNAGVQGYMDWHYDNGSFYDPEKDERIYVCTPPPAPSTLSVGSDNVAVSWSITPGGYSGDGPRPSFNVPDNNIYTISITSTPSGQDCNIVGPSSIYISSGESGSFNIDCEPEEVNPLVNGMCGASNGQTLSAPPTANLCNAGTASPSGGGVWNWQCLGSNGGSNAQCQAFPPSAPTVDLSASPSSINPGQSSTLTWSSTNASSCSASWTGSTATSGSGSVSPSSSQTYSMTCTGVSGSASDSVLVTVNNGQGSVSVTSNVSSSWTVTATPLNGDPGYQFTGSGLSSNHVVSPGPAGTTFTISYGWPSGHCSVFVRNSVTGFGSSYTLFQGQSGSYELEYLPCAPQFSYSLSSPARVNVSKDSSDVYASTTITKTFSSGTTQAVDLSVSGLPGGITYSISNRTCSPTCTSVITFTVSPGTPVGTHRITVTGTPNNVQTSFDLVVSASANITVSCLADPLVVEIGRPVTWTANVAGGEPPYTYRWSGHSIPTNPAPSTNPYTLTYTTLGQKTGTVEVRDIRNRSATCANSTVQVNFNPKFEEF